MPLSAEPIGKARSPSGTGFAAEQLLRHAIFSTYMDCRQRGLEEAEAREILSEATCPRGPHLTREMTNVSEAS